ncbi:hypothetical protein D9757_006459 [Collybiopsis confluens]|uniref:PH domain-containing protein n=1 Tax=Collybiopsis confluens TaxID=2823264 RepID=A0A8H5HJH1_9AGAR|nr:hypothetical protein D9757_006459 [Collybiopsis confluens]
MSIKRGCARDPSLKDPSLKKSHFGSLLWTIMIEQLPIMARSEDSSHSEDSSQKFKSKEPDSALVPEPEVKRTWLYSTFVQAVVIGAAVAFLAPGMYNALSGLGAGGLASTQTWNIATALLFCWFFSSGSLRVAYLPAHLALLCVTCVFGGIVINQVELRWSLAISAGFFAIYAASLYANSKDGNDWFLIFANVLLGIAAGYPEEHNRGRYISIWVFMRNLGPVVGGAILLGLNVTTDGTGSVSLQSYAAFVGIMCGAPFIALLLASPDKVQRSDGTKVTFHKSSWRSELQASWRFLSSPKLYENSCIVFIFNTLRGQYALWIWTSVNMAEYLKSSPVFDWSTPGFGRAYAVVFFWNFEGLALQSFLYWLSGTVTSDLHELVHVTGILRGIEGAGQAVAYGLSSSNASKWVHIGLNMGKLEGVLQLGIDDSARFLENCAFNLVPAYHQQRLMAAHRPSPTQLREKLLSNSPDPIKSSILRESNMGWNSPPTSSKTSASSATSPLRIMKRESSPNLRPTQADLARRSSSSYKHMRNNNLVSKSPFKSQIPTPATPSRQPIAPHLFPTRRVSGEKRPRPPSMHEEAETENDRPFAFKRDRKQSKTFQNLISKEPVTKSPFRQVQAKQELSRKPSPPPLPVSRIPVTSSGSPVRPSLVTKRMHGPRLSGVRRERRKTVTFDPDCDVLEFTRDEDTSGEVFESGDEDDYGDDDQEDADSFFEIPVELQQMQEPHEEFDDIELSDSEARSHLNLDADTSISGLVDEMFAGSQKTSTPPRRQSNELPPDLETEGGIPLGRSHHAERAHQRHQGHETHAHIEPASHPIISSPLFPINIPATSTPPFTPSNWGQISSPPLDRSTHPERAQSARSEDEEFDRNVKMLPESPSPMKSANRSHLREPKVDELLPKFELPGHTLVRNSPSAGPDPFTMPHLKDEPLPPDAGSFVHEDSIISVATSEPSGINISTLEQELGNERIMNTSMEASFVIEASFTQQNSPTASPARRSPLPPIPSSIPHRMSSPQLRSPSPLSPRRSPSPFGSPNGIRPRINRDDVHRRLLRPRSFGSASPRDSPGALSDTVQNLRSSTDRQRIVDLSADLDPEEIPQPIHLEHSIEQELEKDSASVTTNVTDISMETATIETAEKRKVVAVGIAQQHEPVETDASMEVTHDMTMDIDIEAHKLLEQDVQSNKVSFTVEPMEATQITEPHDQSFSGEEVESGIDDFDDEDEEFGMLTAPAATNNKKLKFDFGSKFGLGKLGLGLDLDFSSDDIAPPVPDFAVHNAKAALVNVASATRPSSKPVQKMPVGGADVRMDMRSALDRFMEDVASVGGSTLDNPQEISMDSTEEGDGLPQPMQRGATDSAVLERPGNFADGVGSRASSRSASSSSLNPPPVPPKDNIRTREAMIIEKRRKMRRMEAGMYDDEDDDENRPVQLTVPVGRPSRRRSMSTGDAEDISGAAKRRGAALHGKDSQLSLDTESPSSASDDPLSDSIEKELKKSVDGHDNKKVTFLLPTGVRSKKYLIREREGLIYASSEVSHMAGPGDVNAGRAWRTVRRPSDMNEYAKQIKEFRDQEKPGKAYGKVFVKVLGARGIVAPMPKEQTAVSCTLNNGIHFVTTPDFRLGTDCRIEQEFELIEHTKLEFTLTLKVRRDPHIISQFKALVPPPPKAPPMVSNPSSTSSKSSGMRSFFYSSPKKNKEKEKRLNTPPAPLPQLPPPRLTENLARYLKPDGTLARAFVSFKDISSRCDTRLFETTFPLIGQRVELGNKFSTLQVGELVLQMFRLPALPGLPPEELPQSLEECHRGLRHVNWHKMTYFEGTLTQNGGDCRSWRRRQLRIMGANLVAFNDVTKRVTATINLKNAIAIEDNQDPHKREGGVRSPGSGTSRYDDEYDGLFGVERSFKLVFPSEEILFFADTDEEKARWLEVLRALVGHIPPHPLWAELLWQRQEEINKTRKVQSSAPGTSAPVIAAALLNFNGGKMAQPFFSSINRAHVVFNWNSGALPKPLNDIGWPPSPSKSGSALSNAQSPVDEPISPPAYGSVQGQTLPQQQPYQPYDAARASGSTSNRPQSPLLPHNRAADLESNGARRRESVTQRFCKALAVALLIYVLAAIFFGTLSINVRGFRTRKGWHRDFPIPDNVVVLTCTKGSEMKNTSWGLPFESAEVFSPISQSKLRSVQTSLFLPLASENLFLLSRGAYSSGDLRIVSSSTLEDAGAAKARVDVKILYLETQGSVDLRDTSVCLVQKKDGAIKQMGVGLFSSRDQQQSTLSYPLPSHFIYDVTLVLPEPRGPSILRLDSFETDLPNFNHVFSSPLDDFITFGDLKLKGGNGIITAESITATSATIYTTNGEIDIKSLSSATASLYSKNADIKGHFNIAKLLEIKGANAKVKADIDVTVVESSKKMGEVIIETTSKDIQASVSIHNPSSSSNADSGSYPLYSITASTSGAIDLSVPALPLDSTLRLAASSSGASVTARLPDTYEGAFTITSGLPTKVFLTHEEDPAGLGRQRVLGPSRLDRDLGSRDDNGIYKNRSGTIYWDERNRNKGMIDLKSRNSKVELYF